jgi:hypothetical protein
LILQSIMTKPILKSGSLVKPDLSKVTSCFTTTLNAKANPVLCFL